MIKLNVMAKWSLQMKKEILSCCWHFIKLFKLKVKSKMLYLNKVKINLLFKLKYKYHNNEATEWP